MNAEFQWTSDVTMDDMAEWFRDMEPRLESAMEEYAGVAGVAILGTIVTNAPKDTGQLAGTMDIEIEQVSETEVVIEWGNDEAEYAGIVEFTQPFLAPSLREEKDTIRDALEAMHEEAMDR
ncbi:hypothetical protein GS429_08385 [Natronorubrum sp. JWXQ-INN-674]|uniref:Uncharacterized protein n=1 Tax=Natronorubrum halalkaliphilum TaxID=2691917 RepID=A0A6B0VLX0_9EURY|nr:HK97 gp10 family phage protein [Natronorubrum halalkaliphilum]MXV62077.1 hypothetical protein [Natronorubrum halalkaliphilum]